MRVAVRRGDTQWTGEAMYPPRVGHRFEVDRVLTTQVVTEVLPDGLFICENGFVYVVQVLDGPKIGKA